MSREWILIRDWLKNLVIVFLLYIKNDLVSYCFGNCVMVDGRLGWKYYYLLIDREGFFVFEFVYFVKSFCRGG